MDRLVRRNVLALIGTRGRGVGRRGRAAARQDRHDHDRQSARERVHPDAGRLGGRAGRGGTDGLAGRRDARGTLDRGPGQAVRDPRARHGRPARRVRPVHRADPDERRQPRRPAPAQGRRRRGDRVRHRRGRPSARRAAARARPHRPRGRHAAGRRARLAGDGRDLPQGHDQGGDARALRPPPRHGHPHGDDHRRQPPDRGQDRRGIRRRRLPRRSDARGASSR